MSEFSGFLGEGRWKRVECDWFTPIEGAEQLWAEIRCDLSFGELETIPIKDVSYAELWKRIAPLVRDWNAAQRSMATGEMVKVPPPAEAGVDAFRAVDPAIGDWLAFAIRRAPFGGPDRPKDSPPSSATQDGKSEPVSVSSQRAKSPKGRKG